MQTFEIKTHDFQEAKKSIQEYSQKIPDNIMIEDVETKGGLFGWFDHTVTGEELNDTIDKIGRNYIALRDWQDSTVKMFSNVVKVMEALDKDYITPITYAVKRANENFDKISRNQKEISRGHEDICRIIDKLEEHKNQLDELEHLRDIDALWEYIEYLQMNILSVQELAKSQKENSRTTKKIKFAYIFSGGAFALTLLQFILNVLGII